MFLDFSYMLCLLSMKFEWLSSEYDDPGQQVVSHKPVEQVKHGKHQREHPPKTGKGDFFTYYIQHCFFCRPSDSTEPTDAGIEPRTVATGSLAADALNTRQDLTRLC
jgi:hypothetical protein